MHQFESSPLSAASEVQPMPIPKGNTPYAMAKRAEYVDKDLDLAKSLYMQAITSGERTESAVKDLASLLHQEGNTQAACDLLQQYQGIFTDQQKYQNLLSNLQDKLVPVGNCLNKQLKISPLTDYDDQQYVLALFRDPSRIQDISIFYTNGERYAAVRFASHSAARKTLTTFNKWDRHKAEWMTVDGVVVGLAGESKRRKRQFKVVQEEVPRAPSTDLETAMMLLGKDLLAELSFESSLKVTAQPFVPSGCRDSLSSPGFRHAAEETLSAGASLLNI